MTETQALELIKEAIAVVQDISGMEQVPLDGGTRLLEDVPEFDSLKCVELELLLGQQVKEDLEGVVLPRTKGPPKPLTLGDVATRMATRINGG